MSGAGKRSSALLVAARAVRLSACVGLLLLTDAVLAPSAARASRYTPAEWQRRVPAFPKSPFSGQRKHRAWGRDLDSNFVDDRIPAGADPVRVVVELNDCYSPDFLRARLAPFGQVDYVGQLVSCVYLSGVRHALLDSLARLPEVAMVVWAKRFRPSMGVSVAAVQASPSAAYGPDFVRKDDGGKWVGPVGGTPMTGAGVNIAIVDTGVRNAHPSLPGLDNPLEDRVEGGYDATTSTDPSEAGSDPDPWGPALGHGSRVASIALGRGAPGASCGRDASEPSAPDCAGVAPAAGLVDVKVISSSLAGIDPKELFAEGHDVMRGLDWIGVHAESMDIRIVNISLSDDEDCPGDCPACTELDVLASLGVTPIVGLGNMTDAEADALKDAESVEPIRRVATPAAASSAITVGGSDDLRSVGRDDDVTYTGQLIGPRHLSTDVPDPDPDGEKPDLVAPSREIVALALPEDPGAERNADAYTTDSGTSYAAPLVAGTAALLLQADPALTPAAIKDILRKTADHSIVTSGAEGWDVTFGMGSLDAYHALNLARQADLRFTSCVGVASSASSPCPLEDLPDWYNIKDLTIDPDPPRNGVPCTIKAAVTNDGDVAATNFLVSFGFYDFGAGGGLFHEIESIRVDRLEAKSATEVVCVWTPSIEGHQCLQATIEYGPDPELGNNRTQRNLTVEASTFDVRIDNPYMVPAKFYLHAASDRANWPCTLNQSEFSIGGPEDCPVHVQVTFRAPRNARIGEHADCDISVYATALGAQDSTLIGGVTVRTLVPDTCSVRGRLVGTDKRPIRGVELTFERDVPPVLLRATWEENRKATTSADGAFDLMLPAGAHKRLRIKAPGLPERTIPFDYRCGDKRLDIEIGKDGARLLR